jgi:DNA phosphorothioation-dependent restriction protein DptH
VPPRISDKQRGKIISLLDEGLPREAIAKALGVSPGQVSAVAAHLTMGTYTKDTATSCKRSQSTAAVAADTVLRAPAGEDEGDPSPPRLPSRGSQPSPASPFRVLLGTNTQNGDDVWWYPSPTSDTLNPHLLILGESGSGKTYATQCICTELVRHGIPTIVLDLGQGYAPSTTPNEFREFGHPVEINVGRDGININPLQIFPSDIHGPVNVAQRIADTFARVYPTIGIQQHSVLRNAILGTFADVGIEPKTKKSWPTKPPRFGDLKLTLDAMAEDKRNPVRKYAAAVAAHISTVFIFNTFRATGLDLSWEKILSEGGHTYIVQLKGLENLLQRVVTELLLWNLIGYIENMGPGDLRCMVLLDEAHRLSFASNSPVEKLLREGRKFGIGVILASQQPEDFSSVAFANTASKLIFNVTDERGAVARQIARKSGGRSFLDLVRQIGGFGRGEACFISAETAAIVRILDFRHRRARWTEPMR